MDDKEWQRIRWAAAEEISWGGPGVAPLPPKELPEGWTDVTDVVMTALADIREGREPNQSS